MPWVKIDDQFHSNPKVVAAGSEAIALYIVALSWCGAYLTDGHIPAAQVRRLALSDHVDEAAARLVEVGLWDAVDDGYQIHDYLEYNPSAKDVKEKRAANAERQAAWRDRQRNKDGTFNASNAVSNAVTNDTVTTAPSPSPSPCPDSQKTLVADATVAGFSEIIETWARLFPNRPHPTTRNKALRKKAATRLKDGDFREKWQAAMERMTHANDFVRDGTWFTLNWFLANDENWRKCADGNYDDKSGKAKRRFTV